ncbi:MAG: relaxase domain-containing protein [Phycisphaerales bacterium]|nr:relaxase domain-containing protein [Phycisphaerales bacterium]
MLNITPRYDAARAKRYFRNDLLDGLADEREVPSASGPVWRGKGRELLGLPERVTRAAFNSLCDNEHPVLGGSLTPRQRARRCIGYDHTFNCPKSVSLLYILAGDVRIGEAVRRATNQGMMEVERMASCRVRMGGVHEDRRTGSLLWSEHVHHFARPEDSVAEPHLHVHCFAFNATMDCVESRWKACKFYDIKKQGSYFEAVFHTHLAREMVLLGYDVEVKGQFWEVAGAPPSLLKKFSTRTEVINRTARELGIASPRARARVGVTTRNLKSGSLTGDALRKAWWDRIEPHEAEWLHSKLPDRRGEDDLEAYFTQREDARVAAQRQAEQSDTRGDGQDPAGGSTGGGPRRPASGGRAGSAGEQTGGAHESELDEDDFVDPEWDLAFGKVEVPGLPKFSKPPRTPLAELVAHAAERVFERLAVVPLHSLVEHAMRMAPGRFSDGEIREEIDRQRFATRDVKGWKMVSSPEILIEEKRMTDLAMAGLGAFAPLSSTMPACKGLTEDQRRAVHHVLSSTDSITIIDGVAGSGKTTAIRTIIDEVRKPLLRDGYVLLAPSARASRSVLREEGFKRANTIAHFLKNPKLQKQARGGIVWVDEAGLLGTRDMVALQKVSQSLDARMVLSGGSGQHRSVSRGDVMTVLQKHAGVSSVRMTEIVRQKGALKQAIDAFANGRARDGLHQLKALGMVSEHKQGDVYERAAKDYALATKNPRAKVLAGAPTRGEADKFTKQIRETLKDQKRLKKPKVFEQLKPVDGTLADRSRSDFYKRGQVIKFTRNTGFQVPHLKERWGFKAGSRWSVVGHLPLNTVLIRNDKMQLAHLPLKKAEAFSVFERGKIEIAQGDLLKVTANSKVHSIAEHLVQAASGVFIKPTRELHNGSIHRTTGRTRDGNIMLENGYVVPKDFGHLEHGYVQSSFSLQGQTCDRQVIAFTTESGMTGTRAASVLVSRAKWAVGLHTDDLEHLEKAFGFDPERVSGSDFARGDAPDTQNPDERRRTDHGRDRDTIWMDRDEHEWSRDDDRELDRTR